MQTFLQICAKNTDVLYWENRNTSNPISMQQTVHNRLHITPEGKENKASHKN